MFTLKMYTIFEIEFCDVFKLPLSLFIALMLLL